VNRVDSRLKCKVCGASFKRQSYLKRHMTVHTGEQPYKCSFCHRKLCTKHEHKMHERHHKGELPQCPVCGGRYVALSKHKLIHSTELGTRLFCLSEGILHSMLFEKTR